MKQPNTTACRAHCGYAQSIDHHLLSTAKDRGHCVVHCSSCHDAFLLIVHNLPEIRVNLAIVALCPFIMSNGSEEERREHIWETVRHYYGDGEEDEEEGDLPFLEDSDLGWSDSPFLDGDEESDGVSFQPEMDQRSYTLLLRIVCPKCPQKYTYELKYVDDGRPNFFARSCVRCGALYSIVANPNYSQGYPEVIELFTPKDYGESDPYEFPGLWERLVHYNCPRQCYRIDYSREGRFTRAGTIGDLGWEEKEDLRLLGPISGFAAAIFVACGIDLLPTEV